MKRIILATIAALAVPVMLAIAPPVGAKTIKLGTLAPKGSPWYDGVRDIGEAWKQISGGAVRLRIYSGGVAGDEPVMVRKMRIGQLHAAALTGSGLSDIAPEVQALQMPMMLDSNEELDYVRSRVGPRLEAVLEKRGFKLVNWGDAGWVHFFTQSPVIRIDDLKSQKLFVWSRDTALIQVWKSAGYRPVPLAATDILPSLQTGLITAFPTTPIAALANQWFGLAKNMTDVKWAPLVGGVVISNKTWRKISRSHQQQMIKAARKIEARLQKAVRKLDDHAVEVMKKHGLVVHHVPPEVAAKWETRVRALYPKLLGTIAPADMVAEVERLRDQFRAQNKAK